MDRTFLVLSALAAMLGLGGSGCSSPPPDETLKLSGQNLVEMSEDVIRGVAVNKPVPAYPSSSLQRGSSGIAVAAIGADTTGQVIAAQLLEAPDVEIEQATRSAPLQWKLSPVRVKGVEHASNVEGRITFYFVIEDGKGNVLSPSEMKGRAKRMAREETINGNKDVPAEMTVKELRQLPANSHKLLDVRERRHGPSGGDTQPVNIPLDELRSRAEVAFRPSDHIVLDCRGEAGGLCVLGSSILKEIGFSRVTLLREANR